MSEWYHAAGNERRGPVSLDSLRQALASGELPPETLVWRSGLPDWLPASQVPELAVGESPPPLPAPQAAPPPSTPYAPPLTDATAGLSGGLGVERRRPWPISVISVLWVLGGLPQALLGFAMAAGGGEPLVAGFGLALGLVGLASIAAGVGLWTLKPWGRGLAVAVSIFTLFNIPFGTLIGILLLIYFFSPGVRALYSAQPVEQLSAREQRELAALGSSGLGVAIGVLMLVGVVLVLAIIPAIAVPNMISAIQRGKQKRTMGDLRTASMAIESYAIDHSAFPAGGPDLESIAEQLEPTYIKVLPIVDGWNNPYLYEVDARLQSYRLVSFGKDGVDSGPDEGPTTDYRHDIVFANGGFVSYPDGPQR